MYKALTVSALAALASAASIDVTIGPGLSYSPDTITAAQGDVINFKFGSGHDVVSGSFDSPCSGDGNVYSGMGSDGDVFSMQVNSTDPMWIFCSVPHHCQSGMALVINAPSDKTLDSYKSAAANAGSSSAPSDVTGGVLGSSAYDFGSGSASSSSAGSASSTAAAASSSASSAASSAVSSASARASSASSSASSATASATGSSGADSLSLGMAGVAAMGFWALL